MDRDGIAPARRGYGFSIDMRHKGQINEVEVMLPENASRSHCGRRCMNASIPATNSSTVAVRRTARRAWRS